MNRLHQKCFIGSAGVHLLMLSILLVGPAFLTTNTKQEDVQIIDFVPTMLVDAAVSGGGNPKAGPPPPPAPNPPARQPQVAPPEPEPPKRVEPVKEPEENEPDPDAVKPTKHVPEISTKLVNNTKKLNEQKRAAAEKAVQQRAENARRQELDRQIARASSAIGARVSTATTIDVQGPGGGGPSYASYASEVQRVYREAWAPPEDTSSDDAITRAEIVIRNDGVVESHRIIQKSGDSGVDQSVELALKRVRKIRPFPEGAKEKTRTYIIKFDLKVKRGLA